MDSTGLYEYKGTLYPQVEMWVQKIIHVVQISNGNTCRTEWSTIQ